MKLNNYYIQDIENLKDFITVIFVIVDDIYNEHIPLSIKNRLHKDIAILSDSEIITIIYMKRNNSKEAYPKWARKMIFKIRRRIETTFSQPTEQLNAEVVRAKSFWGLKTRFQTKILAYNLCFFVNELIGKTDNIAKIKNLVF